MATGLKFRIKVVDGLHYPCSEDKGADQLRGYREVDLRLCFRICKSRFSHNEAHVVVSIRFTTRSGAVTDCDRGRPVKSIGTVSTLPSFLYCSGLMNVSDLAFPFC